AVSGRTVPESVVERWLRNEVRDRGAVSAGREYVLVQRSEAVDQVLCCGGGKAVLALVDIHGHPRSGVRGGLGEPIGRPHRRLARPRWAGLGIQALNREQQLDSMYVDGPGTRCCVLRAPQ